MTKFYIDGDGKYIGGFDGALPPAGSIEVNLPPADARMVWDGSNWNYMPDDQAKVDLEKFETEVYSKIVGQGITQDVMFKALWQKIMNDEPAQADSIKVVIDQAAAETLPPVI